MLPAQRFNTVRNWSSEQKCPKFLVTQIRGWVCLLVLVHLLHFRKNDYEAFLATLLLPNGASYESSIAVRAFNVSVASVRDQVTQKTIGQMRMKFWTDSLEDIYSDAPPVQPVALQLHRAVRRHKLSKRWLQRIVSSREEILNDKAFPTLSLLETYAENSVSSVLYLILESVDIRNVHAGIDATHMYKQIQYIGTVHRPCS